MPTQLFAILGGNGSIFTLVSTLELHLMSTRFLCHVFFPSFFPWNRYSQNNAPLRSLHLIAARFTKTSCDEEALSGTGLRCSECMNAELRDTTQLAEHDVLPSCLDNEESGRPACKTPLLHQNRLRETGLAGSNQLYDTSRQS